MCMYLLVNAYQFKSGITTLPKSIPSHRRRGKCAYDSREILLNTYIYEFTYAAFICKYYTGASIKNKTKNI